MSLQNLCNDFDGTTKEGGAVRHALRPFHRLYQMVLLYANHKQPTSNHSCMCKLNKRRSSDAPIWSQKANETPRCSAPAPTRPQSGPFMQNRSSFSSHTRAPIRSLCANQPRLFFSSVRRPDGDVMQAYSPPSSLVPLLLCVCSKNSERKQEKS